MSSRTQYPIARNGRGLSQPAAEDPPSSRRTKYRRKPANVFLVLAELRAERYDLQRELQRLDAEIRLLEAVAGLVSRARLSSIERRRPMASLPQLRWKM